MVNLFCAFFSAFPICDFQKIMSMHLIWECTIINDCEDAFADIPWQFGRPLHYSQLIFLLDSQ